MIGRTLHKRSGFFSSLGMSMPALALRKQRSKKYLFFDMLLEMRGMRKPWRQYIFILGYLMHPISSEMPRNFFISVSEQFSFLPVSAMCLILVSRARISKISAGQNISTNSNGVDAPLRLSSASRPGKFRSQSSLT